MAYEMMSFLPAELPSKNINKDFVFSKGYPKRETKLMSSSGVGGTISYPLASAIAGMYLPSPVSPVVYSVSPITYPTIPPVSPIAYSTIPPASPDHNMITVDKLEWDGSDLGKVLLDDRLKTKKVKFGGFPTNIAFFQTSSGYTVNTIVKPYKSASSIIAIDKLRELFGLRSCGTHIIHVGRTKYILLRYSGTQTLEEYFYTLPKGSRLSDCMLTEIKRIFLMHTVFELGVPNIGKISIEPDGHLRCYSIPALLGVPSKRAACSHDKYCQWFQNQTIGEVALEILGAHFTDDVGKIHMKINKFRIEATKIIKTYNLPQLHFGILATIQRQMTDLALSPVKIVMDESEIIKPFHTVFDSGLDSSDEIINCDIDSFASGRLYHTSFQDE